MPIFNDIGTLAVCMFTNKLTYLVVGQHLGFVCRPLPTLVCKILNAYTL